MNFKKAIIRGVLIWVVIFAIYSVFVAYDIAEQNWIMWLMIIVGGLLVYLFARNLGIPTAGVALGYGLVFAVVGLILDYLISRRFAPNIFSQWTYWVSYLVVLLVPLLSVKKS